MLSFHCQDHSRCQRNSAKIVGARRQHSVHIRKWLCRTLSKQTLGLVYGFLSPVGSFSSLIETHLRCTSRVLVAIVKIHNVIGIWYLPQTDGDVNIRVRLFGPPPPFGKASTFTNKLKALHPSILLPLLSLLPKNLFF